MRTYAVDFRDRALALVEGGRGVAAVAGLLGIGEATLKRWRRRQRETGTAAPKPKPGRPPRIDPARHPDLVAQVRAMPDATLPAHCDAWAATTGVRVSAATMGRTLQKLGLPLKQSAWPPASATRPPGRRGGTRPPPSTRPRSSSSTRRVPTPP
jgi:transposase